MLGVETHRWPFHLSNPKKPPLVSPQKPSRKRETRFFVAVKSSHSTPQLGYTDYSAEAYLKYTEAIAFDPENPILYSNRAASLVKLEKFDAALTDALRY